jgi:hypothetical protein
LPPWCGRAGGRSARISDLSAWRRRVGSSTTPVDRRSPGQIFSLRDPERLRAFLDDAGFETISIDDVELAWEYDSFEDFWIEEGLVAGPYEDFLTALPPAESARVQARLLDSLDPFRTSAGGYRIPGVTLLAVGRRPLD